MAVQLVERTATTPSGFWIPRAAPPPGANALVPVSTEAPAAPNLRGALERVQAALAACHASCANRGERAGKPDPFQPTLWSIAANWLSFGVIGVGAAVALKIEGAVLFGFLGPALVTAGRCLEPLVYRTWLQDRQAVQRPLEQLAMPQRPLDAALVGTIAERALARMADRKVTGVGAGQLLREAAARGRDVDPETRALADKLLTIFDTFLDERGKPAGTLTETQALEASLAYEALPVDGRAQARVLIDEHLLATKQAPHMSGQAWDLLYKTTRATPAAGAEQGGEQ